MWLATVAHDMELDCEGCAGCCLDWRPLAPESVDPDHERRGRLDPLDDAYNLVPLTSDEVRGFVRAGLGDALTPRLFAGDDVTVTVDGHDLAAVDGRPAFLMGLRTAPKPVAPFGTDPAWLSACVFLDPGTLQCRIHGDARYPDACATYPADNLALDAETECERVEAAFGGDRLLDAAPDGAAPLTGTAALGATVFAHPDPDRLSGGVDRIVNGTPTPADRAEFVAVAAASRPGSLEVDPDRVADAREAVLAADSWVGRAVAAWLDRVGDDPDPALGATVEERRCAPRHRAGSSGAGTRSARPTGRCSERTARRPPPARSSTASEPPSASPTTTSGSSAHRSTRPVGRSRPSAPFPRPRSLLATICHRESPRPAGHNPRRHPRSATVVHPPRTAVVPSLPGHVTPVTSVAGGCRARGASENDGALLGLHLLELVEQRFRRVARVVLEFALVVGPLVVEGRVDAGGLLLAALVLVLVIGTH